MTELSAKVHYPARGTDQPRPAPDGPSQGQVTWSYRPSKAVWEALVTILFVKF